MSATTPVIVVMGATGGIGSELVRRLRLRGHRLMLVALDADKLAALAAECAAPDEVKTCTADATTSGDVDAAFTQTMEAFGRVDGAVNVVGSLLLKPAHLTTDEEWSSTLSTNLNSAFYTLRAAVKAMMTTGGSIVLTSTVAAQTGLPNHEAIAAAKGGIDALVRSAASTYASRGIRINSVAPGLVRTPLTTRLTSNETTLKASTAMHPLGRIGEPADIASMIDYLLAPEATWITGQTFCVDGGMSSIRGRS